MKKTRSLSTTLATLTEQWRACLLGIVVALSHLAVSAAGDSKAAKFYEDALIRYEKKDLPGAIIQLKNALQVDKNMLPVQMLLGKALLQSGDVVSAEVAFTEALRLGVNRAEVVIPLGQAYMAQGKHKLIFEQQQFNPNGLPSSVQLPLQLLRAAASADLVGTSGMMDGQVAAVREALDAGLARRAQQLTRLLRSEQGVAATVEAVLCPQLPGCYPVEIEDEAVYLGALADMGADTPSTAEWLIAYVPPQLWSRYATEPRLRDRSDLYSIGVLSGKIQALNVEKR